LLRELKEKAAPPLYKQPYPWKKANFWSGAFDLTLTSATVLRGLALGLNTWRRAGAAVNDTSRGTSS
jgi:hypothetical protein